MTIYFPACLLLPLFATAAYSQPVTVCYALEHRMQENGRELEVMGRILGSTYVGFFIYDSDRSGPCVDHWIFSWPPAILLRVEDHTADKLKTELERHPRREFYGVVKGRLVTQSEVFTVTLPWRRDWPLGHHYLGAAAAIDVSEFRPLPPPNMPSAPRR
jgi:hypothetical protein